MGELRDIAASFTAPPGALSAMDMLRGGAIFDKWQAMGGASPSMTANKTGNCPLRN